MINVCAMTGTRCIGGSDEGRRIVAEYGSEGKRRKRETEGEERWKKPEAGKRLNRKQYATLPRYQKKAASYEYQPVYYASGLFAIVLPLSFPPFIPPILSTPSSPSFHNRKSRTALLFSFYFASSSFDGSSISVSHRFSDSTLFLRLSRAPLCPRVSPSYLSSSFRLSRLFLSLWLTP